MSDQLRVGVIGVGWDSMVQVPAFRAAGGDEALRALPSSDRMAAGDADVIPASGRRAAPIRSLALMLEDWLPALRGEPAPGGHAPRVPTLRDGLVVQQVIDAARRSSAGEGWVSRGA
jgi:hypothetical protein